MTPLANLFRFCFRYRKNRSGAVATEYTFVIAFIAIIAAAGMTTLGFNIESFYGKIGDGLGGAGDQIVSLTNDDDPDGSDPDAGAPGGGTTGGDTVADTTGDGSGGGTTGGDTVADTTGDGSGGGTTGGDTVADTTGGGSGTSAPGGDSGETLVASATGGGLGAGATGGGLGAGASGGGSGAGASGGGSGAGFSSASDSSSDSDTSETSMTLVAMGDGDTDASETQGGGSNAGARGGRTVASALGNDLTVNASFRKSGDDADTPPVVNIVNPSAASRMSGTVLVEVRASDAQDAAGTLMVEVSTDGGETWYEAVSSAWTLYDYTWTTPAGEDGVIYTLMARATDSSGSVTTSTAILVAVDNVGEPLASVAQKTNG